MQTKEIFYNINGQVELPNDWRILRLKNVCHINKNSLSENSDNTLELEYVDIGNVKFENGIVGFEKFLFKNAPSRARRIASKNDTIISTVRTYLRAIDFIDNKKQHFIFSTGFAVLSPFVKKINPIFLNQFVKSTFFSLQVKKNSKGMSYPAINSSDLSCLPILCPPILQQKKIANYLNIKLPIIDQAIAQKERMIELLQERKQIVIQNAVTKGIDSKVKMKDSRVEWIGEIPDHWQVKRAKYLFFESDERSIDGSEELLSVSHMTGVSLRSEIAVSMFKAEDYSNSKICRKGDLVYNIMWAWMGALGISFNHGIVSPSYAVYRTLKDVDFNSWYLEELLKSTEYLSHYNKVSTGLHSSRLRFYSRMFFEMEIGFPKLNEQNLIEKEVKKSTQKIDNLVSKLILQIQKLKEYKTTLIDHAVTGKIKVS